LRGYIHMINTKHYILENRTIKKIDFILLPYIVIKSNTNRLHNVSLSKF
jgi:hypothetical protein